MPTNNPTPQTPSPSGTRIGTEHSSSLEGRLERGSERVERGIEQLATTAADRVREAREHATSGLTEQRDMVAKRIRRLSGVLRAGSDSIAADDPLAQNLLDSASDRIERLAEYVSQATPAMVSDDLQRVARRRPGLFFGSAFLLGLAVGRFVRSSTKVSSNEEFDIELEEDVDYGAARYERPYPGRPLSSTSPTSEAAAPGTGATASYTSPSTPPRPYTNNPVPPVTTTSSTSGTASYGTRPTSSSISGSAGGSGTMPPPYGGSASSTGSTAGATSATSTPVRTQSTTQVGSNAASNESSETQRGQGAKS